ncbi:MAG TPA: hypothetical protein VNZ53_08445 [Steroidobacteraceae bacterium]|nr:hypothetical protein [Steroidobacteraceae bacterium]
MARRRDPLPPGKTLDFDARTHRLVGDLFEQRSLGAVGAARPAMADYRSKFALDSPVEGAGFEPSVPRDTTNL